jgi:hypothetical protein
MSDAKEPKKSLRERWDEAQAKRKLPPAEGHEFSADGKEMRTPTRGEFFGALEKVSKPEK